MKLSQTKHLIMGTAGHVDHGKTALVKALTGFDCDTHPEEKSRGITINLGFAHIDVGQNKIGIVDVPGHKDFVHTMVGGASGIDFAILVVAADSGVMPQTREHLEIMNVLGVKSGFVVITKADLVTEEVIALAVDEIKEITKGTFLDECPIIKASAITGEGIDDVKAGISQLVEKVEQRASGEIFRMFVDRIFTVKGFGSVVNGSVMSGSIKKGDNAYLIPFKSDSLRIRRIERDRAETDEVCAGDRASLNLVGLDRKDFQRGQVVSDRELPTTQMIDAQIKLFQNSRKFGLWTNLLFHLGTFESMARIHLLDKDEVRKGESVLVQIHMDKPCAIMRGDRFIIRNSSGDTTLGGGEVIDPNPLHHRRRRPYLIKTIQEAASGNLAEMIGYEVRKEYGAISSEEIAISLNLPHEKIIKEISNMSDDVVVYPADEQAILILKEENDRLEKKLLKNLESYHKRNPLEVGGRTDQELIGILSLCNKGSEYEYLQRLCAKLAQEKKIKKVENTWAMFDHKVIVDPNFEKDIAAVEKMLLDYKMQTPLMSEMLPKANKLGLAEKEFKHVLHYLIGKKRVCLIESNYIHTSVVNDCRKKLLEHLAGNPTGITVAEFRDLVGGNRKICLLLLGKYDSEGTTKRVGDRRMLSGDPSTPLRLALLTQGRSG
ncbi:MAG: selenocysteine-specific translation elongation factor [Pseudomonadota bacterium]